MTLSNCYFCEGAYDHEACMFEVGKLYMFSISVHNFPKCNYFISTFKLLVDSLPVSSTRPLNSFFVPKNIPCPETLSFNSTQLMVFISMSVYVPLFANIIFMRCNIAIICITETMFSFRPLQHHLCLCFGGSRFYDIHL